MLDMCWANPKKSLPLWLNSGWKQGSEYVLWYQAVINYIKKNSAWKQEKVKE